VKKYATDVGSCSAFSRSSITAFMALVCQNFEIKSNTNQIVNISQGFLEVERHTSDWWVELVGVEDEIDGVAQL